MNIKSILAQCLAVTAAAFGSSCAIAGDSGELRDFSPLLRPVLQSDGTTKLRLMTPVLNVTRTGGVPTSLSVALKVWDPTAAADAASGPVPLFTTLAKSTPWSIPCVSPVSGSVDYDSNVKFFGRSGGARLAMIVSMNTFCRESSTQEYKESGKVFFYSANVQSSSGGSWAKAYAGQLLAANGVDLIKESTATLGVEDGIKETFMLSIAVPGTTGPLVQIVLFDSSTGAAISNPAWKMPSTKSFSVGTGL